MPRPRASGTTRTSPRATPSGECQPPIPIAVPTSALPDEARSQTVSRAWRFQSRYPSTVSASSSAAFVVATQRSSSGSSTSRISVIGRSVEAASTVGDGVVGWPEG